MRHYVYLIVSSSKKNRLISYVGYTNNLKKRLFLHNSSKGAKFTRGKQWNYAYCKGYNSKIKAMREEYVLKKNTKKRNMIKKEYQLN